MGRLAMPSTDASMIEITVYVVTGGRGSVLGVYGAYMSKRTMITLQ